MSQIDALQARITEALDRIGRGVEARVAAAEAAREELTARLETAEAARDDTEGAGQADAEAAAPETGEDAEEVAALRAALEEERLANAQLEARVRVLHSRLAEAAPAGADEGRAEALQRLDAELQALRQANERLRESNAALRAAHEAGSAAPELFTEAMQAEIESLRAARATDRGEVALVLAEIDRALAEADDQRGGA